MALDKTFASGDILSAGDVNGHLLGLWIPIDKRVIASGSPVSSISFQSIDSNFRNFRLTYDLVPSTSEIFYRLNNDSGTNYNFQFSQATGGNPTGFAFTSQTGMRVGSNSAIRVFGQTRIGKLASGVIAYSISENCNVSAPTIFQQYHNGFWNNTSALINRIDFYLNGGGTMYGIAALEGMRGV